MCMACNNRICQVCGHRYGYHRARDNACPKEEFQTPLTFGEDFIDGQFFKKKERKKKQINASQAASSDHNKESHDHKK